MTFKATLTTHSPAKVDRARYLVFESERACPLCRVRDHFILSRKMQFGLDCTTVICRQCGFCFVSPAPTKAAYFDFYRDAYTHYYGELHPPLEVDSIVETREEAARLNTVEKYHKLSGARLLEIGPGNGRFLVHAFRRGAVCDAIEPSQEFRSRLQTLGIRTVGEFLETTTVRETYDIVALFQVLEHLHDPGAALDVIGVLLSDDGVLVMDVPNIRKPYRSLSRHFLRYVHLSYFSPASLERLLRAHGLEPLHVDTTDSGSFHYPKPIFIIAKKAANGRPDIANVRVEDWRELAALLRRYRLTYPFLIAPRMHFRFWKSSLRRLLADRHRRPEASVTNP